MTGSWLTTDERFAAALAALGAGPSRLRRLLEGRAPAAAWMALARGCHPADPDRTLQSTARPALVAAVAESCRSAGIGVRIAGHRGYPAGLAGDYEAPGVLFTLGDASCCDTRPRVAVVGTRSATPYGLSVAAEMGRGLAEAGVTVISGLSPGIDSAAHAGALAASDGAPPVAVIGTAPDAAVARAEAQLRLAVAETGAVVSARPPGSVGTPVWCFAVRNRMLAALAHVVVVVECHGTGAALTTVKAATDRDVPVLAVPGSVRSAASVGTNALLVDGASPARDVHDVLAALELAVIGRPDIAAPGRPLRSPASAGAGPVALSPRAARTLAALDHDPASLDTVVRRTALPLADVAEALEELTTAGVATGAGGRWSRHNG